MARQSTDDERTTERQQSTDGKRSPQAGEREQSSDTDGDATLSGSEISHVARDHNHLGVRVLQSLRRGALNPA